MKMKELGIEYKKYENTKIASIRTNIKTRKELQNIYQKITQVIPREEISGPAFCIFNFVTNITEGFDIEAGFPISQVVHTDKIKVRILPKMEVLSLIHNGPVKKTRESYKKLYGYAAEHGLISDEFNREIYIDTDNPEGNQIELQFVIHNWNECFAQNLSRVVDEEIKEKVMEGSKDLTIESSLNERFQWVTEAMKRLDSLVDDEYKRYDIVSSCSHVFPQDLINQLKTVYETTLNKTNDSLEAVDSVIEFMDENPAWPKRPIREGNIIYETKNPRDPQGYEKAKTAKEKRQAYCFCPLVRDYLDQDVPITFCYCGAGWYRLQWEGAIGKSVKIDVVKSVLKGDDECQFAIHLPNDL